jgi:hypothetical protein
LPVTGDLDAGTCAAITTVRLGQESAQSRSVVILGRSYVAQVREVRGISFSIADEYRRAGWRVTTLEDPTTTAIRRAITESHARVLHICAPVAEATRTGGLYLDIGQETDESFANVKASAAVRRTQGLPVTDLAECLRGRFRDTAPVVVLDPPDIPTYTEAIRQLILRNAFASDVFQLSVAPAIIGTGLLRPGEADEVGFALVSGLETGQPLTAVSEAMRRVARPYAQEPVQFAATTALYTHYADYAPWPQLAAAAAR